MKPLKIEHGVPPPDTRATKPPTYPELYRMVPGDSLLIPYDKGRKAQSIGKIIRAIAWCKRSAGLNLMYRTDSENAGIRVWCLEKE